MTSRLLVSVAKLGVIAIGLIPAAIAQTPSYASSEPSASLSDVQVSELQSIVNSNPDAFGGLWADLATGTVTIRIPSGAVNQSHLSLALKEMGRVGSGNDPKAASIPKRWLRPQFITSGPSIASLRQTMALVQTAEPFASEVGASLDDWYIDPREGKVVIDVEVITAALSAAAETAFGNVVDLRVGSRANLLSRAFDGQPYYGSDEVVTSGGSYCTVAFEAYNGTGQHGMLSAGHCWSNGTTVYQGYYDSHGVMHTSGTMGRVTAQSWGNNVVDGEFINASVTGTMVSDDVWIGPNPPCCAKIVTSSGSSYIGQPICFDGAITGENCYAVVQQLDTCVYVPPYTECHLDMATASNGSTLAQRGDSGGPVEGRDGGSGLIAYGTITAKDQSGHYWYSDLTYVLNALGVGLIVN